MNTIKIENIKQLSINEVTKALKTLANIESVAFSVAYYSFSDRNVDPLKHCEPLQVRALPTELKSFICAKYSSKEQTFVFDNEKYKETASLLGLDPLAFDINQKLTFDQFVNLVDRVLQSDQDTKDKAKEKVEAKKADKKAEKEEQAKLDRHLTQYQIDKRDKRIKGGKFLNKESLENLKFMFSGLEVGGMLALREFLSEFDKRSSEVDLHTLSLARKDKSCLELGFTTIEELETAEKDILDYNANLTPEKVALIAKIEAYRLEAKTAKKEKQAKLNEEIEKLELSLVA